MKHRIRLKVDCHPVRGCFTSLTPYIFTLNSTSVLCSVFFCVNRAKWLKSSQETHFKHDMLLRYIYLRSICTIKEKQICMYLCLTLIINLP